MDRRLPRAEREALHRFGNALRDVLGLSPIYQDARSVTRDAGGIEDDRITLRRFHMDARTWRSVDGRTARPSVD
jgi:hypothetical protein